MPKILGIDLGTTNSCAALFDRGAATVILNAESGDLRTLPTVVSLRPQQPALVGSAARRAAPSNPQFTFSALKRLVGRRFDDASVQALIDQVPFDVVEGPDGLAWVQGPERQHAPEELLALVLARLKQFAEADLGEPITHCVLATPAYFDALQEAAVRAAATRAGFTVLKTVREPTAAALAHQLERGDDRTVCVYDFGGGTFDVSILRVTGRRFRVLATAGDTDLGGGDFDRRIAAALADRYEAETELDPRSDLYALQRLLIAAEEVKRALSNDEAVPLRLDNLMQDPRTMEVKHLAVDVRRSEIDALCADLVERSFSTVALALKDAKLAAADVDDVVLVGGMTRMPAIRRAVASYFGRQPVSRVNPDEAVAIGAAAYAATLTGEIASVSLNELVPISLGVALADGRFQPLIKRRQPMPATETARFVAAEGQDTVAVRVYQGERPTATDNRHVATLALPVPPDQVVEVTLRIAADGVLSIAGDVTPDGPSAESGVHLATGLSAADALAVADLEEAA